MGSYIPQGIAIKSGLKDEHSKSAKCTRGPSAFELTGGQDTRQESQSASLLAQLKLASKGTGKWAAFTEQYMYSAVPPLPLLYLLSASIPHCKSERWPWVSKNRWSTIRKLAISSHIFLWVYSKILQTYRRESCGIHSQKAQVITESTALLAVPVFSEDLRPPPTTTQSPDTASTLDLLIISFPPFFSTSLRGK